MKRLLSMIPLALTTRALARTGLGVLACLAILLTTANAQDWTGTVSCVETDLDTGVSETNVYPVEIAGGVIYDRWGEGRDVEYGSLPTAWSSEIFWTTPAGSGCAVPVSPTSSIAYRFCLHEELQYSETGSWRVKAKKGEYTFRGTSFVVMEYNFGGAGPDSDFLEFAAECTWNLAYSSP